MSKGILPFATITTVPENQAEIRSWLKLNRKTLADRDVNEVAHLAIICGFEIADICQTLVDFRDAMAGSHLENRAAFQGWRTEMAMADFMRLRTELERIPELDLRPLWKELAANTTTGEEEHR